MFDKLIRNCLFLPRSSQILSISLISESKCLRSPPNDAMLHSSDWSATWHILYIRSTGQLGWLEERLISTRQNSQLCHIIPGSSLPPLFTDIIVEQIYKICHVTLGKQRESGRSNRECSCFSPNINRLGLGQVRLCLDRVSGRVTVKLRPVLTDEQPWCPVRTIIRVVRFTLNFHGH
jgi:hypothetical protein